MGPTTTGPWAHRSPRAGSAAAPAGGTEVLGFAASDYDDTAAGVDRDVAGLSTLAVTGATLGSHPGTVEIRPVSDGLVRAHLAGAEGLLVISNYDGRRLERRPGPGPGPWQGRPAAVRVRRVLRHGPVPRDGVVLDFKNLDEPVRDAYPMLVGHLAEALRRRRVLVLSPPSPTPTATTPRPSTSPGCPGDGVGIVWMAYDQHDPTSEAGPVAGLPWVRDTGSPPPAARCLRRSCCSGCRPTGTPGRPGARAAKRPTSPFPRRRPSPPHPGPG